MNQKAKEKKRKKFNSISFPFSSFLNYSFSTDSARYLDFSPLGRDNFVSSGVQKCISGAFSPS